MKKWKQLLLVLLVGVVYLFLRLVPTAHIGQRQYTASQFTKFCSSQTGRSFAGNLN